MFNANTREEIYGRLNCHSSGFVENGRTIIPSTKKKIEIPPLEALAQQAFKKLEKMGFSVIRTAPKKANCIIRVYRHDALEHDFYFYWMYGVDTYLKTGKGFISEENYTIDYSKFEMRWWFCQDDYAIMRPHFADYFILVR